MDENIAGNEQQIEQSEQQETSGGEQQSIQQEAPVYGTQPQPGQQWPQQPPMPQPAPPWFPPQAAPGFQYPIPQQPWIPPVPPPAVPQQPQQQEFPPEKFDWGEALRDPTYFDRYLERKVRNIREQLGVIAKATEMAKVDMQINSAAPVLQSFSKKNEEVLRNPAVLQEFSRSLMDVGRIAIEEGDASPLLNEEFYSAILGLALARVNRGAWSQFGQRPQQQSVAAQNAMTLNSSAGTGTIPHQSALSPEEDALRREWGLSVEEWEANKLGIGVEEYRKRGGR